MADDNPSPLSETSLPDISDKLNTAWRPIRQMIGAIAVPIGSLAHLVWFVDQGKVDSAVASLVALGDGVVALCGLAYTAFSAWQHVATSAQAHTAAIAVDVAQAQAHVAIAQAAQAPAPAPTAAPVAGGAQ